MLDVSAVPTSRVIFMAKSSLDLFSLSRKQGGTYSVLGDQIYEMRCLFVAVGPNITETMHSALNMYLGTPYPSY